MYSDKLIVFDLFGVIFSKGLDSSIEHLTAVFNKPARQISKIYRKLEIKFDLGEINEIEFWEQINEDLHTDISPIVLNNIVISSYQLKKETIALVSYLKKYFPLAIYSNYRKEWFEKLDSKYEISKLFDSVYISSETGQLKPNKKAFDILLNEYNISKNNIILIDDDATNIRSFNRWGGHGILFENIFETETKIRNIFQNEFPKYDDFYSGIIIETKEKALILQRRDNNKLIENPGKLSVFGGRSIRGENQIECAIREIYEEIGLKVVGADIELLTRIAFPTGNGNWMLCAYFIVRNVHPNSIILKEGFGIEIWHPKEAIKRDDLTEVPKYIIKKYLL